MLNKIDSSLLEKISILNNYNREVDVIVKIKNTDVLSNLIKQFDYINLPIISSVGMRIKIDKLPVIAEYDDVEYIYASNNVCGLIYDSKKIINTNELLKYTKDENYYSCVVIDTGIYPHIDFCLGKNRLIKFVDLINNRKTPYDDNGHGTFVSGVMCANSITDKYSGVDSSINLISIKALDKDGETSSIKILEAMQWILDNKVRYNIKVVCMSFGSQISTYSDPLIYGVEVLWDNGIVVVSAGGNSGPEYKTIMSPGASKKIITVGSLKCSNGKFEVADFSSRGPVFGKYKPDIVVPGVDIISTTRYNKKHKEFYTKMSGTSVSTPMVAGVVSLLFKINPNYTPNQIKYMIVKSGIPITGDRNSEGFGRLDLSKINLL